MIFFESNSKITAIFVLAALALVFVFAQWLKSEPFSNTGASSNQLWAEIKDGTSDKVVRIVDNLHLGWLQLQDFKEEVDKQAKQQELVKITKDYLTGRQSYDNQADCEAAGGGWGIFGEHGVETCKISMIDGGQECSDSSQCQGRCIIIDWPEIYQLKWSQGESVSMNGNCADSNLLTGCFGLVEDGLVSGLTCE